MEERERERERDEEMATAPKDIREETREGGESVPEGREGG